MNVAIQTLVRHFLAAVGATGVVSDDDTKQIAGALVTLAMVAWSLYQKRAEIVPRKPRHRKPYLP